MHELPWITIFGSRVRRFANDFHEGQSHEWKSLAIASWVSQKSLFMVTNVLFYFLHAISFPEHTIPLKTIIDHWCRHLRTVFSDLVLWCHHGWSVMSHNRRVLALWRHIHQMLLHVQIGAKAIFTSEWITALNIDFSPPSIHSLAWKKILILHTKGGQMW